MALRHAARKAWWMLVDGGGDVVAMCERVASGSTAYAAVSAQWTYDAYGAVIDEEVFDAASPVNRAGHKGLFADRLDVGVVDEWGHENCRLIPGAELAFYNRNRTYSPYLGRFLQSDPNATGVAVSHSAPYHGSHHENSPASHDMSRLYFDGANLYQYLASNSWHQRDPLGLWMWGDWSDTLFKGAEVFGLVSTALDTHQFVMDEAADWAGDWSRSDDEIGDLVSIANSVSGDIDIEVDAIAGAYAPLIAGFSGTGKALSVIAKVTSKARNAFSKWFNKGKKDVSVYLGTRNGKPYVGNTNDVDRRAREHGVGLKPIATNLTKNQARAIENQVIKANPHFDNIIQSISDRNRYAIFAEEWATAYMKSKGIRAKP